MNIRPNLQIRNLCFIDQNNNRRFNVFERARLVLEIRNNGNQTLSDVTPLVNCSDLKHILILPAAIICEIRPEKVVRCKAERYKKSCLYSGAEFTINFAIGEFFYIGYKGLYCLRITFLFNEVLFKKEYDLI